MGCVLERREDEGALLECTACVISAAIFRYDML